jgi:hypothetical protein
MSFPMTTTSTAAQPCMHGVMASCMCRPRQPVNIKCVLLPICWWLSQGQPGGFKEALALPRPCCANVHPVKLVQGLADAVVRHGERLSYMDMGIGPNSPPSLTCCTWGLRQVRFQCWVPLGVLCPHTQS